MHFFSPRAYETFGDLHLNVTPLVHNRVAVKMPKLSLRETLRCRQFESFHMCAHNGTHIDAPYHFINEGKTIDKLDLNKLVGPCYVYFKDGELGAKEAERVIKEAENIDKSCAERLLFKGKTTVTEQAAEVFASHNVLLVGNESHLDTNSIGLEYSCTNGTWYLAEITWE